MTSYFMGCETVNEIKAMYRKLAMRWHPDRPAGDNETMKAVNAAYESALKGRDGEQSVGTDGKTHYYRWDETIERAAMDIISKLLAQRWSDIEIDLVGTWIWVGGNTRDHKDVLKAMGLHWHSKRVRWFWKPEGQWSRYNGRLSYGDLQQVYGCRSFESDGETGLAVA